MSPPPSFQSGNSHDDGMKVSLLSDEDLATLVENGHDGPECYYTPAPSSDASGSNQQSKMPGGQDCISAAGSYYKDVEIRQYHTEDGTQVNELVLPKEKPLLGFVQLVPSGAGGRLDRDASSLVINYPSGQRRSTVTQLGSVACGYENTADVDLSRGWIGYRKEMYPGSRQPHGAMIWGPNVFVDNGNGTKSIEFRKNMEI
jgi:hypothetical protein